MRRLCILRCISPFCGNSPLGRCAQRTHGGRHLIHRHHPPLLLPSFRLSACTRSSPFGEWTTLYFMLAFNCRLFILCSSALREKKLRCVWKSARATIRLRHRMREDKTQLRNEDIIAVIFLGTNGGPAIKYNEGDVKCKVPRFFLR